MSTQVLLEFYAAATRKLAVDPGHAAAAVERFARLPLVRTDAALVLDGIEISRSAGLSIWDAMIVAAARAAGCERLITEDLNAGQEIYGVRVENPFA